LHTSLASTAAVSRVRQSAVATWAMHLAWHVFHRLTSRMAVQPVHKAL
jgi:hypothetical protein